jgi:hypothetical protein
MTTAAVEEYKVILSVGDTTFLDYRGIKVKKEGYGPTGAGGNGLRGCLKSPRYSVDS